MSGRSAIRRHPDSGITEEVAFFDELGMFGITHMPEGGSEHGVVICSTVHAELFRSYRKEVLLGRALAEAGIAVQRFHYPGEGNSLGDPDALTVETMQVAAERAVEHLRHRHQVTDVGLVGTRLGGFAATAIVEPGAPLLLWDPVIKGDAFLSEIVRSHQIAALRGSNPQPSGAIREQLDNEGSVELLGYRFSKSLYDSVAGRSLGGMVPQGPVRVVPFGTGTRVRRFADGWAEAGVDVSVPDNNQQAAWWLIGTEVTSEDGDDSIQRLVADAVGWITGRLTV